MEHGLVLEKELDGNEHLHSVRVPDPLPRIPGDASGTIIHEAQSTEYDEGIIRAKGKISLAKQEREMEESAQEYDRAVAKIKLAAEEAEMTHLRAMEIQACKVKDAEKAGEEAEKAREEAGKVRQHELLLARRVAASPAPVYASRGDASLSESDKAEDVTMESSHASKRARTTHVKKKSHGEDPVYGCLYKKPHTNESLFIGLFNHFAVQGKGAFVSQLKNKNKDELVVLYVKHKIRVATADDAIFCMSDDGMHEESQTSNHDGASNAVGVVEI